MKTPQDANWYLCVYCWPRLRVAHSWDEHGLATCCQCLTNPQRKCGLPSFALRDIRGELYPPMDKAA